MFTDIQNFCTQVCVTLTHFDFPLFCRTELASSNTHFKQIEPICKKVPSGKFNVIVNVPPADDEQIARVPKAGEQERSVRRLDDNLFVLAQQ